MQAIRSCGGRERNSAITEQRMVMGGINDGMNGYVRWQDTPMGI
jgi:hypothetical protein